MPPSFRVGNLEINGVGDGLLKTETESASLFARCLNA